MIELIGMFAEVMPEDIIIDQLQEALDRYKKNKSDENKSLLQTALGMLGLKLQIEKAGDGLKIVKEVQENKAIRERLKQQ